MKRKKISNYGSLSTLKLQEWLRQMNITAGRYGYRCSLCYDVTRDMFDIWTGQSLNYEGTVRYECFPTLFECRQWVMSELIAS